MEGQHANAVSCCALRKHRKYITRLQRLGHLIHHALGIFAILTLDVKRTSTCGQGANQGPFTEF